MKKNFLLSNLLMLCLLAASSMTMLHSRPVGAQERPLDAPRAQGLIGERYDGYAVVHDAAASPEVRNIVQRTNDERRKVYEDHAKSSGAPAAEVGKVYAAEILRKAPPGTWFQGPDGTWTQK